MKIVETKINTEDSTKKKSLRQRLMEWTGINAIPINHRISAAKIITEQRLTYAKAIQEERWNETQSLLNNIEILEFNQRQAQQDPARMQEIEKELTKNYAALECQVARCESSRNYTILLEKASAKLNEQSDAQEIKGYQLVKTYLFRQANTPAEMIFSLVYGAYETLVGKEKTKETLEKLREEVDTLPEIIELKKANLETHVKEYKEAEAELAEMEHFAKKCENPDELKLCLEVKTDYQNENRQRSDNCTEQNRLISRCETMLSERAKILGAVTKAKQYLSRAS